jgi:hypothetical protein
MMEIPDELLSRRDAYCQRYGKTIVDLRGYGMDAFVWQTDDDDILKVFRHARQFAAELAVYRRLDHHSLYRLRGFSIPYLLRADEEFQVLQLSYVSPPYILDFAAASLDRPSKGFDPDDPAWIAEQRRRFGRDWPEVKALLDALRHHGIHYEDVHEQNIRLRPD